MDIISTKQSTFHTTYTHIYSIMVHLQESYMFICFICISFQFYGKFKGIVYTLLGPDQELKSVFSGMS